MLFPFFPLVCAVAAVRNGRNPRTASVHLLTQQSPFMPTGKTFSQNSLHREHHYLGSTCNGELQPHPRSRGGLTISQGIPSAGWWLDIPPFTTDRRKTTYSLMVLQGNWLWLDVKHGTTVSSCMHEKVGIRKSPITERHICSTIN